MEVGSYIIGRGFTIQEQPLEVLHVLDELRNRTVG